MALQVTALLSSIALYPALPKVQSGQATSSGSYSRQRP